MDIKLGCNSVYVTGIVDGLEARWNGGRLDPKQASDYLTSDVPMLFSVIKQLQERVKYLDSVRLGYRTRYINLKQVVEALKWEIGQIKDNKE